MDASAQLTTGLAGRYIIGRVLGYGAAWSGLADAGRKANRFGPCRSFSKCSCRWVSPGRDRRFSDDAAYVTLRIAASAPEKRAHSSRWLVRCCRPAAVTE